MAHAVVLCKGLIWAHRCSFIIRTSELAYTHTERGMYVVISLRIFFCAAMTSFLSIISIRRTRDWIRDFRFIWWNFERNLWRSVLIAMTSELKSEKHFPSKSHFPVLKSLYIRLRYAELNKRTYHFLANPFEENPIQTETVLRS